MQCTKFEFCGSPNRNQIQIEFHTQRETEDTVTVNICMFEILFDFQFFLDQYKNVSYLLVLVFSEEICDRKLYIYTIDWNKLENEYIPFFHQISFGYK